MFLLASHPEVNPNLKTRANSPEFLCYSRCGCQRASRNCTQSGARIVNLTTSLYQCRHLSPPVIGHLGHLGILVILVTSSMVILVGRNSTQSIPGIVNFRACVDVALSPSPISTVAGLYI